MGEMVMECLLLCHEKKAEKPFYLKEFDLRIYTMEELCYCLYKNVHMLDRHIMKEQLCMFLQKELGFERLAAELRQMIETKQGLEKFVLAILEVSGLFLKEELENIGTELREIEGKSSLFRKKARGDYYLEHAKYAKALYEYQQILETEFEGCMAETITEEMSLGDRELLEYKSNVIHNMGTVYARLFSFEEAARYFYKSYEMTKDNESLESYLMALHMYLPREQYIERVTSEMIAQDVALGVEEKFRIVIEEGARQEDKCRSKKIFEQKTLGNVMEYYEEVDAVLEKYKEDYKESMML